MNVKTTLVVLGGLVVASNTCRAGLGEDLVEFNDGSNVRVVWLAAEGTGGGGMYSLAPRLHILMYDAETDTRDTLSDSAASYNRPLFTWDGDHVVYTVRKDTAVMISDFDGENKRTIARGLGGGSLWRDSETDREYLLYVKGVGGMIGEANGPIHKRCLADTTDDTRLFGPKMTSVPWLCLSRDGRYLGGAWPWASVLVYDLKKGTTVISASGCWTSMPWDDSHRFLLVDNDHTVYFVFGPGDETTPVDTLDLEPWGDQIDDARMASYTNDCIVVTDADGEVGPGDIRIYRTDDAISEITGEVTVPAGKQAMFPDVWLQTEANENAAVDPRRFGVTAGRRIWSGGSFLVTLDGRTVLRVTEANGSVDYGKDSEIPPGCYLRVTPGGTPSYRAIMAGE